MPKQSKAGETFLVWKISCVSVRMKNSLVIGSRGSKLALTQARLIQSQLQTLHPSLQIEIKIVKTSGDASTQPLSIIGGKGVFTKELEDALLRKEIDFAVHSLKDLPTIVPDGLMIAAVCEREDARDALVLRAGSSQTEGLAGLPEAAIVGTSSPRRLAQLKHRRPDVVVKELRGNVDTRLRKLDEGQYDALILASAGLKRLGLSERISAFLSAEEMLPAVGQGALAIETRLDDAQTIRLLGDLNHAATETATNAERAFLRELGGGCQLPIAAHAVVDGDQITLDGLVADVTGTRVVRDRLIGTNAEEVGGGLAKSVMAMGADALWNS